MVEINKSKEEAWVQVKSECAFTVANNHLTKVNENVSPANLNKS